MYTVLMEHFIPDIIVVLEILCVHDQGWTGNQTLYRSPLIVRCYIAGLL